jgi:hypothetical protein
MQNHRFFRFHGSNGNELALAKTFLFQGIYKFKTSFRQGKYRDVGLGSFPQCSQSLGNPNVLAGFVAAGPILDRPSNPNEGISKES